MAGPPGAPTGFCIAKGDELYQLFVAAGSRGSGVAAALLADAETRLADSGVIARERRCRARAIAEARAARLGQP